MRHGSKQKKFGRLTKQRGALIRSLAVSLISKGRISTTKVKAKVLKTFIEKLVTKSRTDSMHTLRHISSVIGNTSANQLIKTIGPKYKDRAGGYTRIITLPPRMSDGAERAIIEFI